MITRLEKQKQIQIISDNIKKAKASFLINFQGLSVQQITEIRKDLRNDGLADMKVCRNTLVRKALDAYPAIKEYLSPSLTGPNAFVFAYDDPSRVAKILSNYVDKTETLQIKPGVLEGKGISVQDIKVLATLPSIEILRAQFLSVLSAPMSRLQAVFSAVPKGLLQALSAYKDKEDRKT